MDVVLAPMSTDIVSPGGRFRYELPRPARWPEYLRVTAQGPGSLCGVDRVDALDAMGGRGRVVVVLRPAGGGVELDVLDEGPGLALGVIDHVFDPFFTTKAPGRGTGLGLSICYGIMSELGGRIECGNRPEGGAWFRIQLPADEAGSDGGAEACMQ